MIIASIATLVFAPILLWFAVFRLVQRMTNATGALAWFRAGVIHLALGVCFFLPIFLIGLFRGSMSGLESLGLPYLVSMAEIVIGIVMLVGLKIVTTLSNYFEPQERGPRQPRQARPMTPSALFGKERADNQDQG